MSAPPVADPVPAGESRYRRYVTLTVLIVPALFLAVLQLDEHGVFEKLPTAVQALLAGVTFAGGLAFAFLLVKPRWRRQWLSFNGYDPRRPSALVVPILNTFYLLMTATMGFAFLSGFLYVHGIVDVLTPSGQHALDDPINSSAFYYIWSFLNAIPVLEIPHTLGWEPEFRFTDHVTPPLLLLYKLVVILPVIAVVHMVVKDQRARSRLRARGSDGQRDDVPAAQ